MEEVVSQIPIKRHKCYDGDLKVVQHKKISHNKMFDVNGREVDLYIKRVKDRNDFESDALPLTSESTIGKEEKASSGGFAETLVALYLESALKKDDKNDYIIVESAFAAQVGTIKHACRILGIGGGTIEWIKTRGSRIENFQRR